MVEAKWTKVLAVALTAVAIPPLAARAAGGESPDPSPRLAALTPVATPFAVAGVAVAAATSWWLALLLSAPAAILLAWQLPPPRRPNGEVAQVSPLANPEPGVLSLRVLTLNVEKGSADPAAVVREVERHEVDVLVAQELTPDMVDRLAEAGVDALLPFCHLDPRPGRDGTGLWVRWPLAPLPPVPGMEAAAPRARIEPVDGWPVTLTGVHPRAPLRRRTRQWRRELAALRSTLVAIDGHQVVAGDFNATRDHGPFRDLLDAGFLDCADAAQQRPWPAFTWPADGRIPPIMRLIPPIMRLDHVLVSRTGATVSESRIIPVSGTDHHGVLAVIELAPTGSN